MKANLRVNINSNPLDSKIVLQQKYKNAILCGTTRY